MTKDILAKKVFILMDEIETLNIPERNRITLMNGVHSLAFDAELVCNDSPLMDIYNAIDIWIEDYCFRDSTQIL